MDCNEGIFRIFIFLFSIQDMECLSWKVSVAIALEISDSENVLETKLTDATDD